MASKYLEWKYRDVKPDEKIQYTRKQKALNWLRYHWIGILIGIVLLWIAADLLSSALGLFKVQPDAQVACVISFPLDESTVSALQSRLESRMEDGNGDGRTRVQVNQYVTLPAEGSADNAQYSAASQVRLMADMESCESYFFLCDDPEKMQENYQILAGADGKLAESSGEPFAVLLRDIPLLSDLPGLENAPDLYLCRRGFWEERTCRYQAQCDTLWQELTKETQP